jgi:hypothetical protein
MAPRFCPLRVAIPIKGSVQGLIHQRPGCEWQDKHWFQLKARPKPIVVASRHDRNISEPDEPISKERDFVRSKAWQGSARARRPRRAPQDLRALSPFESTCERTTSRKLPQRMRRKVLKQLSVALS